MIDVVVIGGGHAGVEAAAAASRIGASVALVTRERSALARLSCNPAVGGTAKGQLVKEIDALGGLMAVATDLSAIQYRMLNRSKGPAVWSPRAQTDRALYSQVMDQLVQDRYPDIQIIEDEAVGFDVRGETLHGVILSKHGLLKCRTAILCAGTFLHGLTHCGADQQESGRFGEPPANLISEDLRRLGFPLLRFKTGTPPRVYSDSIDLSIMQRQDSEEEPWFFSHETTARHNQQLPCYRAHTVARAHDLIRDRIDESPMYNGTITSIGPRYCPSIEDKVMRFPDREGHPLIFEPEGLNDPLMYVNGFSSSMPEHVQLDSLRMVPGCEYIRFAQPGYAVEYDVIPAHQIRATLATRNIPNLYLAGQINGTSGYEEAAIQGLMAGANAALSIQKREPMILHRDEAYGGVLIDDLVTTHPTEPYRMFTSRAEFRLLLRQDNAEERLHEKAYHNGLITTKRFQFIQDRVNEKRSWVDLLTTSRIRRGSVLPDDAKPDLVEPAAQLMHRQETRIEAIIHEVSGDSDPLPSDDVMSAVEIELRYSGYLNRERRQVEKLRAQEEKQIPDDFEYEPIVAMSAEGREKLILHRPATIGQASRICGVTPADLALVVLYMRERYRAGSPARSAN
ncbi:MAG TPA: tRNA uridine-5-carboxymethylaminomethyl(34) synthesis enzyme MnmG [Bacteroidetes bacterium]|nr:tRNA uridine 5-carboxymethylaminomethyl modification enzyme MnmG [bacterium BMS3Bbin04]HDO64658.1 tRNA uridine-5-carboxymethylaminomethyl(34) synthesis enzyme MnmG [Bacteroidota bacterium]HEX03783.1 tRNA uridine-5-carboxymethylaminomethyl(34) synthesis enzyme MnmG [Bacteroidota bacterium]